MKIWSEEGKKWERVLKRDREMRESKESAIPITLAFETCPSRCADIISVVKRSLYRRGLLINSVQRNLNDSHCHQYVRPVRIH